jgi:hypothetical protein
MLRKEANGRGTASLSGLFRTAPYNCAPYNCAPYQPAILYARIICASAAAPNAFMYPAYQHSFANALKRRTCPLIPQVPSCGGERGAIFRAFETSNLVIVSGTLRNTLYSETKVPKITIVHDAHESLLVSGLKLCIRYSIHHGSTFGFRVLLGPRRMKRRSSTWPSASRDALISPKIDWLSVLLQRSRVVDVE